MSFSVIDFKQAQVAADAVEDKAVSDLTSKIIPVIAATANSLVEGIVTNLQVTLADFVNGLSAVKDETLNELDGWTITIQPIVIKLERGKK